MLCADPGLAYSIPILKSCIGVVTKAIFESIPVRYANPDFAHTLALAHQTNMYAYDAYFLGCAIRHINGPPLTNVGSKAEDGCKESQSNHMGGPSRFYNHR